ncbi:MAG TPA: exopolysaccharide biosynthesis protein [Acetobacteraceae bacterium]|nr:exopolysaccharide biosynthesis protein [Acetobacteraceae bacterium]
MRTSMTFVVILSSWLLPALTAPKPIPPPDAKAFIPASVVLQRLHDEAPADSFTLGWLMGSLRERSFGIIMLLLALVAIAPGVAPVAGLLLMVPAFQMIAGQPAPVFPRRIAARPLPTRRLAASLRRAVPVLRYLETMIHPRWPTLVERTKRLVGGVVVMLSSIVVFVPIPLTNVIPALAIALISLAYLEEDGVLLSIALLAAVIVLAVAFVAVWGMVRGAQWIGGLL